MTDDQKTNNVIGWTVVGTLFIAYKLAGFWPVVGMLLLFVVLLATVGHLSAKMFDASHQKAAERHQKENDAAKAELARTLREVSRLRAQGERRRTEQALWGRN